MSISERTAPSRARCGARPEGSAPSLLADTRGVVFLEYIALVATVAIVVSAAIVALGVPLLRQFRFAEAVLALPFP
jgi:hypothetical protein